MKFFLSALSLGLAVAAAIIVLVVPSYSSSSFGGNPTATLLEVSGQRVIIPVLFPVVVAMMALIFPTREVRIIATILMFGFTVIGSFTIGIYYFPAAVAMLAATQVAPGATAATNHEMTHH